MFQFLDSKLTWSYIFVELNNLFLHLGASHGCVHIRGASMLSYEERYAEDHMCLFKALPSAPTKNSLILNLQVLITTITKWTESNNRHEYLQHSV